jgi:cell division initiation protein
MKLTPIDIQQQQFRKTMRGFDSREVQSFLDLVAQQLGELSRENNELRVDLRRTQREIDDYKSRETTLKEAMLTAQRAIEEIREQAQKEAQLVISEAELRADKIVQHTYGKVNKVLEEMSELKRLRARAIEELRGIVHTHTRMLEDAENVVRRQRGELIEDLRTVLKTHERLLEVHDEEKRGEVPEATVTVLERLRAPAPPSSEDLSLVDART